MPEIIDQRSGHQRHPNATLLRDIWANLSGTAQLALMALTVVLFMYFKNALQTRSRIKHAQLQARRRAGIPDSDRRPYRIAFVDAEKARLEKAAKAPKLLIPQTAQRTLKSPASRPNLRRELSRAATPQQSPSTPFRPSPLSPHRYSRPAFGRPLEVERPIAELIQSPPRSSKKRGANPEEDLSEIQEDKRRRVASRTPALPRQPANRKRRASDEDEQEDAPPRKERKREAYDTDEDIDIDEASFDAQQSEPTAPSQYEGAATSGDEEVASQQGDVDMEDQHGSSFQSTQTKRERSPSGSDSRQPPSKRQERAEQGTSTDDLKQDVPMLDVRRRRNKGTNEVWENAEGQKCRTTEDGREEQLVQVRERRRKYHMPPDSKHPDRDLVEVVIKERWATEEERNELKRAGVLVLPDQLNTVAEHEDNSAQSSDSEVEQSETSIFFARGSRTPFYATSPRSSSTSLSLLANGRIRLPSNLQSNQMTPRRSLVGTKPDGSFSQAKRKSRAQSNAAATVVEPQSADTSAVISAPISTPQTPVAHPAVETNVEPAKLAPVKTELGRTSNGPTETKPVISFSFPPASAPAASAQAPQPAQPTLSDTKKPEQPIAAPTVPAPSPFSFEAKPAPTSAPSPAFNFGPAPAAETKQAHPAANPIKPTVSPFAFGNPEPKPGPASQTGFSFGNTSSAPSATDKASPAHTPGFSFGSASKPAASSAGFGSAATGPSSGSFGNPSTTTPTPSPFGSSPAPQFGSAPTTSNTPSSFTFANGASASTVGTAASTETGSSFIFAGRAFFTGGAAGATPAFKFGDSGSPAPASPGVSPGFVFNAGSNTAPATGSASPITTTPIRRTRPLPRRR